MRRTLIASLFVAAAAGVLLTGTALSEGPESGRPYARIAPAAEHVTAADGSGERAAHFVEVAKQYAEILPADELEQEIAALERKLTEARAARQLRGIRTELEKVVREFPDTEAAKAARAATKMLQQPSAGEALEYRYPTPVDPFPGPTPLDSGGDDVFRPQPVKR